MKKFEGLLFCTDLDGTLFTDDKTVSKENLDAIEYFKSQGGRFTFITGRVPALAKEITALIKPNAPYGCNNGGGIYDSKEDKYLWNISLQNDAMELIRQVDKNLAKVGIQCNTKKHVYFNKYNDAMVHFREVTGLPNKVCHYEDVKEDMLKVVFSCDTSEQMASLIELLHAHPLAKNFDFIRSEEALYEILPKGASKGGVLCKMAELLKIDMKNTIAVGDYNNDVSMIKVAGKGFAVENAVPEAKAVAKYITVNNNEHAICSIIEGFDREKY